MSTGQVYTQQVRMGPQFGDVDVVVERDRHGFVNFRFSRLAKDRAEAAQLVAFVDALAMELKTAASGLARFIEAGPA